MSARELLEHLRYWADDVKIDRYRRALAEVLIPGSTVLDLGTGTGLLGLLACEAGAGKVYAVETGPIASVAAEVFARNRVDDRVEVIRGVSTEISLPEQVDLVIGDQIGGFAYGAGVLHYYEDAGRRFLRPGGTTIPSSFELYLAPVEHLESRNDIDGFTMHNGGFDLNSINELVANTVRSVHLGGNAILGTPVRVRTVEACDANRFQVTARLEVQRAGRLDGVAGFFRAHMSPSIRMSNLPDDPDELRHRWQDLFPVSPARQVSPGDVVEVDLVINPVTYLTAWSIGVDRGDGFADVEHHSSFEGELLDPQRFRLLTNRPLRITEVGREVAAAVAGCGDDLDVTSLTEGIAASFPDTPRPEIERTVRRIATAAGRA